MYNILNYFYCLTRSEKVFTLQPNIFLIVTLEMNITLGALKPVVDLFIRVPAGLPISQNRYI